VGSSKLIKSPNLSIVLQLTQVSPPDPGGRGWEVHDVERNRGFRVRISARTLKERPQGRELTEADVEGALGLAIERALVTPPEKLPGQVYDLELGRKELFDFVETKS
jgi:hypothetical protein